MIKGGKRAIEIAHRRWGKDEIALAVSCELLHKRVGSVWHCLPEYGQARKAIWEAVNAHTGKRRIDEAFPPETRTRTNAQEMFIELQNGSTWQCIGSDRYDATVGAGPVFIAYSEWALANPSAWAYHRPMLEENEKVQTQWQNFPLEQHKRRRCWVKELDAVPSAAAPNESACQ